MRFLIGLALGVAIGLVVAPQVSENTISELAERGMSMKLDPTSLAEGLLSRAGEAMEQGRQLYDLTKDELVGRYSELKSGIF